MNVAGPLGATFGNASCGMNGAPTAWAFTSGEFPILAPPLRLGEFVATLALAQDNAFGQPLESQLRSCLLATWMCEAAGFEQGGARHRLLGGAAPVRRLHRPRPRGRHRLRRRDRDPRPDAGPRRRESRRGHARRRGLRDGRSRPGRARADRADDPADRPRVGGAQLRVGVRSGRHARATARLRPRRSRGAALHVRALERQWLSRPCARRGDPAGDARRAPQPRHGGDWPPLLAGQGTRRRPRSSRPHVRPGARRPVRRAWTQLVRQARARWSRGMPCSTSSRNHAACWTAPTSTTRSRWRRTSST